MQKMTINEVNLRVETIKTEIRELHEKAETILNLLDDTNINVEEGQLLYDNCKKIYMKIKDLLLEQKFYEIQLQECKIESYS